MTLNAHIVLWRGEPDRMGSERGVLRTEWACTPHCVSQSEKELHIHCLYKDFSRVNTFAQLHLYQCCILKNKM